MKHATAVQPVPFDSIILR